MRVDDEPVKEMPNAEEVEKSIQDKEVDVGEMSPTITHNCGGYFSILCWCTLLLFLLKITLMCS